MVYISIYYIVCDEYITVYWKLNKAIKMMILKVTLILYYTESNTPDHSVKNKTISLSTFSNPY